MAYKELVNAAKRACPSCVQHMCGPRLPLDVQQGALMHKQPALAIDAAAIAGQ